MLKSLCVFCGSRSGTNPIYAETAREVGEELAARKITLIYGGGRIGIMGIIADSVMENHGEVIGVIPDSLMKREVGHNSLTALHVVETMHQRKSLMADLAEGFVALPGGIGTFEELFEILTWGQLGFHKKPIALLNTAGFYDPLIDMLARSVVDGFLPAENLALLQICETTAELFDFLAQHYTQSQQK